MLLLSWPTCCFCFRPGTSLLFALKLVEELAGHATYQEVKSALLVE